MSGRKGTAIERKAIAILRNQGYRVHRTIRSPYRGQNNDVFGCIDLIAKKRHEPTRWIQVTTMTVGLKLKAEDIKNAKVPWGPQDSVEIWRWKGGQRTKTRDAQFFYIYKYDLYTNGDTSIMSKHKYKEYLQ